MPIPFIFGAVALGATVLGAAKAMSGKEKFEKAKEIGEAAQFRYENEIKNLEKDKESLIKTAEKYTNLNIQINRTTIGRFIIFVQKTNQHSSHRNNRKLLINLNISSKEFKKYQQYVIQAEDVFCSGIPVFGAGALASQGLVAIAGLIGTASTGTAISGLSGAAATNATLAWIGGGSLATGGGGMALGSLVLGGVTIGSALMVGGFVIAAQGEEALDNAKKYEAQVNDAIIKIHAVSKFLEEVSQTIEAISNVVQILDQRINTILNQLESRPFDKKKYVNSLKWVAILMKAIEKIQKTSILDKNGRLNPMTQKLLDPQLVNMVEREQKRKIFIKQATISILVLAILALGGGYIFTKYNVLQQKNMKFNIEKSQYK